ncbi:hypothetical protein TYRP_003033 [Tyrophagus putrescentiae]|nr:hypothetical protein TYRP_003033 [Tyrophagus putrescentiae]
MPPVNTSTNTAQLDEVPIVERYAEDEEEEEDEEDEDDEEDRARRRNHIVYTVALYYCFICVGLCYSIFNPTLVQLSTIFGSDLRGVSLIFPARSIGSTLGTLTNGFLNRYINRQCLLFTFLLLKSLTTFLVPHWTTVEQFCINGLFNGFFTSAIVVMVNVWLNELWSWSARRRRQQERRLKRARLGVAISRSFDQSFGNTDASQQQSKIDIGNVLMQALHFFFGFGCILGPLLAEPFLRNPFIGADSSFFSNCLVTPYTIASSTALLCSLIFFALYVVYPYDQPDTRNNHRQTSDDNDESQLITEFSEDNNLENSSKAAPQFTKQMHHLIVLSSAVLLFVFVCSEGTYFQFSASFGTKASHLSEPDAALLASALAISFTVFRALSVLIALRLTAGQMIALDLVTVVAGNTLVYLFAGSDTNKALLVVGVVLLGAGFSSVFPCIFSHLEANGLTVTDMVGSLLTFAGGISEVLAPFIIGLYIDTRPYVLVYFTFLSVALSGLALGALNLLLWFARRPGQRQTAAAAHSSLVL